MFEFFSKWLDARSKQQRGAASAPLDVNLLDALMEHIPDNIYFKGRDSRFIRISEAAAKWFGLESPEAAKSKTDFDLFLSERELLQIPEFLQRYELRSEYLVGFYFNYFRLRDGGDG